MKGIILDLTTPLFYNFIFESLNVTLPTKKVKRVQLSHGRHTPDRLLMFKESRKREKKCPPHRCTSITTYWTGTAVGVRPASTENPAPAPADGWLEVRPLALCGAARALSCVLCIKAPKTANFSFCTILESTAPHALDHASCLVSKKISGASCYLLCLALVLSVPQYLIFPEGDYF